METALVSLLHLQLRLFCQNQEPIFIELDHALHLQQVQQNLQIPADDDQDENSTPVVHFIHKGREKK